MSTFGIQYEFHPQLAPLLERTLNQRTSRTAQVQRLEDLYEWLGQSDVKISDHDFFRILEQLPAGVDHVKSGVWQEIFRDRDVTIASHHKGPLDLAILFRALQKTHRISDPQRFANSYQAIEDLVLKSAEWDSLTLDTRSRVLDVFRDTLAATVRVEESFKTRMGLKALLEVPPQDPRERAAAIFEQLKALPQVSLQDFVALLKLLPRGLSSGRGRQTNSLDEITTFEQKLSEQGLNNTHFENLPFDILSIVTALPKIKQSDDPLLWQQTKRELIDIVQSSRFDRSFWNNQFVIEKFMQIWFFSHTGASQNGIAYVKNALDFFSTPEGKLRFLDSYISQQPHLSLSEFTDLLALTPKGIHSPKPASRDLFLVSFNAGFPYLSSHVSRDIWLTINALYKLQAPKDPNALSKVQKTVVDLFTASQFHSSPNSSDIPRVSQLLIRLWFDKKGLWGQQHDLRTVSPLLKELFSFLDSPQAQIYALEAFLSQESLRLSDLDLQYILEKIRGLKIDYIGEWSGLNQTINDTLLNRERDTRFSVRYTPDIQIFLKALQKVSSVNNPKQYQDLIPQIHQVIDTRQPLNKFSEDYLDDVKKTFAQLIRRGPQEHPMEAPAAQKSATDPTTEQPEGWTPHHSLADYQKALELLKGDHQKAMDVALAAGQGKILFKDYAAAKRRTWFFIPTSHAKALAAAKWAMQQRGLDVTSFERKNSLKQLESELSKLSADQSPRDRDMTLTNLVDIQNLGEKDLEAMWLLGREINKYFAPTRSMSLGREGLLDLIRKLKKGQEKRPLSESEKHEILTTRTEYRLSIENLESLRQIASDLADSFEFSIALLKRNTEPLQAQIEQGQRVLYNTDRLKFIKDRTAELEKASHWMSLIYEQTLDQIRLQNDLVHSMTDLLTLDTGVLLQKSPATLTEWEQQIREAHQNHMQLEVFAK